MHAPILVFSTDANETLHFDEDEIKGDAGSVRQRAFRSYFSC